ncbi:MAG: monomethylamine:corrinoid methyltransferase [Candidatus Ranarchaeia archaeon]
MVVPFSDIAIRAETGALMLSDDFNLKLIPKEIMALLKEHGIKFDGTRFTQTDNSMIEAVWEAGFNLFLKTGIYSVGSRRRIMFTEDEVSEALRKTPHDFTVGQGDETKRMYARKVEDSRPPLVFGGPMNADTDEHMFVRLAEAFARETLIDVLFLPGHIRTVYGVEIRLNSALEQSSAVRYAMGVRQAIRQAGRPGLAVVGFPCMGHNAIAASNEKWGLRRTDPRAISLIAELSIQDVDMSKLAHYHDYGCPIYISSTPLIGGFSGSPEGTAVLGVAAHLACLMLGAHIFHMGPQHIKYGQQTNAHSLRLASTVKQAIAKHTDMISLTSHTTTGRPGTKQYMYELAALELCSVTAGSHICGPRPAMPVRLNHVSPLIARWFAEVGHAAAKMTRDKAEGIVKTLYEKYKDHLIIDKEPLGNTFDELYDTITLQPKPEHLQQYEEVKDELKDLGLPLSG